MIYRRLGRTGLEVSALALGTVELGLDYGIPTPGAFGKPSQAESIRIVHTALDAGVNFIDTARVYGSSEAVLGLALQDRRERVILATKAAVHGPDGQVPQGNELRRTLLDALHTSLTNLRTDHVDVWQIHNVDGAILERADELADVFDAVRRAGLVRWTGGSFYGAEVPLRGLETGLFDVMQVTYSVFDRRLEDAFFGAAQKWNVGVVARSVLLKGVLTERAEHLPPHLESLRVQSRRFREVAARSGLRLTPAQVAVAFAINNPSIHSVLVGVRSAEELQENLQGIVALPDALIQQLRALRVDDPVLLDPSTWGIP